MIVIDYKDKRPLYEQIYDKFRNLILLNVLSSDDKLPSVRNLALELSINPNTIQKAYSMLEQSGLIYSVKGIGNFVNGDLDLDSFISQDLAGKIESLVNLSNRYGISKERLLNLVEEHYAKLCK